MIIGTAGHIDHGKTSLVRALTGVDTDRLKEEKARGITIELGFAYVSGADGVRLGFVDVPGHEKFVHTMVAGASGIDFALLVIAADDGIMPQTREHLAILDLLGVTRGIVALTKADLVDDARRDEVAADIRAALAATGLHDAAIVPVSAATGKGLTELRRCLFDAARVITHRSDDGPFRLAIDRSFTLHGAGTIITGTALSGTVREGDRLTVSPSGIEARVRSIHAQGAPVLSAQAGMRVALNIAGEAISKDAIKRGDMAIDPMFHAPAVRIDAQLSLLASESRSLAQWTPVRLHHGAADVAARISLLTDTAIAPGGAGLVQLVLERPIAAAAHDRFVIRNVSGKRTLGGGVLLDLRAPRRKRRTPERVAQLEAHALPDPRAALAAFLATAPFFVALNSFARDRALTGSKIDALSADLALVCVETKDGAIAVAAPVWAQYAADSEAALGAFHAANPDLPGMSVEGLRLALKPRFPAASFPNLLTHAGQSIAINGPWARLRSHAVRLTAADEHCWAEIAPLLSGDARFRPPRVRDIAELLAAPEPDIRRLMKLASRLALADEVAPDHFFLRTTVAEMADIAIGLGVGANDRHFAAAQFRDRLRNGRKVAIQILEFFDRHGVTIRRGDLRRISPSRKDLFRADPPGGASAAQAAE